MEDQVSEEPKINSENVQGIYNVKSIIPTEKGPGLGQYRSSEYIPKGIVEEVEQRAQEHVSPGQEPAPTVSKTFRSNGQKIEMEEIPILEPTLTAPITPELTPEQKFKIALEAHRNQPEPQTTPNPSPLKTERPQSESSKREQKYKEELIRSKELENKFKEEKTQLEIENQKRINAQAEIKAARETEEYNRTVAQADAKRKQEEFEKAIRLPGTAATIKAENITAQQRARDLEEKEKEYQYSQDHPLLYSIGKGAEKLDKGLSVKSLTEGLDKSTAEFAKGVKNGIQIDQLRGQVISQANPTVQTQQSSASPSQLNSYYDTAHGVGGNYQNVESTDGILDRLKAKANPSETQDQTLMRVGGGLRERG